MADAGVVLVTGAAGFIGSHVCSALLRRGCRVIGLDNFDPFYARALKDRNLARIAAADRRHPADFTLIEGDITNEASVAAAMARCKSIGVPFGIIHLAAKAGVKPSATDPVGYVRTNVLGTAVILDQAHKAGASRVVVASSSSVYGNCETAPFHEELDVSKPISPYAASKKACELIGHTHHHLTGMPTAMLRFFTVYGPGQRPDLAISLFLGKAMRDEPITLYGSMSSSRDYTYIDDIAAGVIAAYDRVPSFGYRVWNLGNSSPVTLQEMIDTIGAVSGRKLNLKNEDRRAYDVERTFACLKRSGAELDYKPTMPFAKGVAMQYEAMKKA